MPLYDFSCQDCGDFTSFRPMADRNDPANCPHCAKAATRLILAPNLAMMNPLVRKATAINEKSRHEPRVSDGHSCGSRCGCGSKSSKIRPKRTRETKLGKLEGQKPSARPWMLGH
ncbi:FmdB family zinc ribbon protein [Haloferula sp.]|uniref:FmdB family zinc ribbon protein n=1 Tax=Haloferula sp. TaxID=2497595 RepID=UPI003C70804B